MIRYHRGFTLIEVLVALGIVALALVSGLQATMALTRNAQRQADVLLAQVCAENDFACTEAGRDYQGRLQVSATPNPIFRRVDAQVLDGAFTVFRITTIVGSFQ